MKVFPMLQGQRDSLSSRVMSELPKLSSKQYRSSIAGKDGPGGI